MSIKKVSKEQPNNFKFTDENLKEAEKAIKKYKIDKEKDFPANL